MPEMTIRLEIDPASGKKNVVVSMRSDEDALPHEHEQMHRQFVDKLIEGGILKAGELGKIVVERVEEAKEPAAPVVEPPQPQRQPQRAGQ